MSEQVNMATRYEHEIPEGYEARIEGNKVIIEKKESEDERIRKAIGAALCGTTAKSILEANGTYLPDALAYLEKQKEIPMPDSTELIEMWGREEAMLKEKDLPRWRTWENGACGNSDGDPIALVAGCGGIRFVSCLGTTGEKYIFLSDLKKLPGFKED